jgi:hypothetical protein
MPVVQPAEAEPAAAYGRSPEMKTSCPLCNRPGTLALEPHVVLIDSAWHKSCPGLHAATFLPPLGKVGVTLTGWLGQTCGWCGSAGPPRLDKSRPTP